MSELSERSGVPVATIKWWRREGLVPPGDASAPNQADYGESHLARVRLLRALREVADLSTAALAEVTAVLDDPDRSLHEVVGVAHAALDPSVEPATDRAAAVASEVIERAGWDVADESPARVSLARTLDALSSLGWSVEAADLDAHVDAAARVSAAEVGAIPVAGRRRDDVVRDVVVGTVLFERVLTSLRRLAQEHVSGTGWRD